MQCRPPARKRLIEAQATILARLAADLSLVIEQFDYRFGGAPQGPHATAWRRAARLISGADRWVFIEGKR